MGWHTRLVVTVPDKPRRDASALQGMRRDRWKLPSVAEIL